jgi:DNA (cytosine-5)-methyltransferase 1
MALGFENAGFECYLLSEYDKHAVATLRQNRPQWPVIAEDIRETSFLNLRGAVDVVTGGFPCQAFSLAGKRQGFADARGSLFFEFARAVREIQPKVAVGENVKGIVNHDGGRTMQTMLSTLRRLGYRVAFAVLNAQYFDVPQRRERVIIMAVRRDLGAPPTFPPAQEQVPTLRQAIGDGPPSPGFQYAEGKRKVLSHVPPGGNWRDVPGAVREGELGRRYLKGRTAGVARRLAWDAPTPTLLCNPIDSRMERCHPAETRPLNVREYARIQTFPDSWEFCGSLTAQYRQIGNAVPVNLAYHVGLAVATTLGEAAPVDQPPPAPY